MSWMFDDPSNTAVFTSKRVLSGAEWIACVTHDADDGAWQFHGPGGAASEAEAVLVGLGTIVKLDPSLTQLADLALGWCAWRTSPSAPWHRRRSVEAEP